MARVSLLQKIILAFENQNKLYEYGDSDDDDDYDGYGKSQETST